MGLSEIIMEAIKNNVFMSERLDSFTTKLERLDDDVRNINDRLIRIETMVEMAQGSPKKIK